METLFQRILSDVFLIKFWRATQLLRCKFYLLTETLLKGKITHFICHDSKSPLPSHKFRISPEKPNFISKSGMAHEYQTLHNQPVLSANA